ncbi:MAG TPA: PQQ-binding-like beta-propeller repeat protein, partial [Planctomycetota bacterium]|nr:PQQ-binding-like beta-propeller repeat protein [Planctomycetota bacterium]
TRGPWKHRLTYLASETITVEARRPGFNSAAFLVSYQTRKGQVQLALARGPLWQTDLGGATGVTTPIALGKFVLLGTSKATIEVVDSNLGASRPINFPQTVDEFRQPPVVFQNQIYTILENRLTAVDATTRTPQWSYPQTQGESPLRLTGAFYVQEHQLIPGQLLFFLGCTGGEVVCFARDPEGRTIPYPKLQLGSDLSGQLQGDQYEPGRTLLYAPAGNHLRVYDTTATTERSAPVPAYELRTRGELIGQLTRATVAGHSAMLAIDSTGLLVAVDANPAVGDSKRTLGSWALDGSGVVAPAYRQGQSIAYVAVAEGRVVAVDLARPGQLAWRFPAQGTTGPLAIAPAIGQRGVYIADLQGTLRCLDAATGVERWHADLGSPPSSGILVHDGRLFVPTRAGALVCFEEGDE